MLKTPAAYVIHTAIINLNDFMNITLENDDPASWKCLCGNTSFSEGFMNCTNEGEIVSPDVDGSWNGITYICFDCGRIINQHTLEIGGRRLDMTLTEREQRIVFGES
jgi:hypothetical protein